jgi:hypothetical protein
MDLLMIDTLTPLQVAWVEENPDFWSGGDDDDSEQEHYEDVSQEDEGQFVNNYPAEESKVLVRASDSSVLFYSMHLFIYP